jgi:hypothetical protein
MQMFELAPPGICKPLSIAQSQMIGEPGFWYCISFTGLPACMG